MIEIDRSLLFEEIYTIRMTNNDVRKLIADINAHWAKASSMGVDFDDYLKPYFLIRQASLNPSYKQCINNVQDASGNERVDFDRLSAALIRRQIKQEFADTQQAAPFVRAAHTMLRPPSYYKGRPGPNGEPSACYNCYQPGHIALICPQPKRRPRPKA